MGIRRPASGNDYVLALDPAAGTNYTLLVCLLSNALERTSAEIDASSKCGPATLPGTQTIKIPFELQNMLDTANGEISEYNLHSLWENRTVVTWKFGKLIPAAGDETYTGSGYITQLNTTSAKDGVVTTSVVLSVTGNATQTRTGS